MAGYIPGFRRKRIRIAKLAIAPITHISDPKALTTEVANGPSESNERSSHSTEAADAADAAPNTTRSPRNADLAAIGGRDHSGRDQAKNLSDPVRAACLVLNDVMERGRAS
jgi:hypothetical protein